MEIMRDDEMMNEMMNENALAAVFSLRLERMPSINLAVMNNVISVIGRMDKANIGFQEAVDAQLIRPDGTPYDKNALLKALAYEIGKRMKEGRFS